MPSTWQVVGGQDRGGIMVREGPSLSSAALKEKLQKDAVLEQVELSGDRLHFKLLEGRGPREGWCTLTLFGRAVIEEKDIDDAGPAEKAAPVQVDEALGRKVSESAARIRGIGEFANYCPKYKILGFPLRAPKFRVICLPGEGATEAAFTASDLALPMYASKVKNLEICALNYPGRDKVLNAKKEVSISILASNLLAVLYDKIADNVPYIIWAHSLGTWIAFELLMACRMIGLPLPLAACLSAFPGPHLNPKNRRWGKTKGLGDDEFRQAVISWDPAHFDEDGQGASSLEDPMWSDRNAPMLRTDLQLIDDYRFRHDGAPKFDFPIHAWHMAEDAHVTADMVKMWGDWTTGEFDFHELPDVGHNVCAYSQSWRDKYCDAVTYRIKEYHRRL